MPKMKTHKAGAKRYRVTGTGKLMRSQGWRGHLNSKKSGSRKRRLEGMVEMYPGNAIKARLEIPYPQYLR